MMWHIVSSYWLSSKRDCVIMFYGFLCIYCLFLFPHVLFAKIQLFFCHRPIQFLFNQLVNVHIEGPVKPELSILYVKQKVNKPTNINFKKFCPLI